MKTRFIVAAGLFILLSASVMSAQAQQFDDPSIKILPTSQKGILKVVYAYTTDQPVEVKFFNEDRVLGTDKVKGFRKGFSKKYDVHQINTGSFWIEVSTASMSVTFKLTETGDQNYLPILEKTSYNHALVASNTY